MSALSIAQGATDVPLLETTIGQALLNIVADHGDGLALVSRHQSIRWTWAQLLAQVDAVATGLLALGVGKGDRVGIWAPNCAEWTVIQFATARIGAILVNINPAYRTSEVDYALNKVGCSLLVTAPRFKSSDYVAMLREIGPDRLPALRHVVVLGDERHGGWLNWSDLLVQADPARLTGIEASLDRNDPINIQFTSGTTGQPKGATLTHRNVPGDDVHDCSMVFMYVLFSTAIKPNLQKVFGTAPPKTAIPAGVARLAEKWSGISAPS